MLYNKNRFKKLNVKKVLHKVKKQWVTISIALLGLLGVKSVAMHTNVNADVTNANNDDQANHQLGNHSLASANSTLVHSNGAKLTNVSSASQANSSVANVSASTASNSAQSILAGSSAKHNSSSAARLSTYSANHQSNGLRNIPSEAERVHDDILGEYARSNEAQGNLQSSPFNLVHMVHHMLGEAPAPQVRAQANTNDTIASQLMSIIHDNVQSGANETDAKNAYSDLMNIISPSNLVHVSNNAIDGPTWYSYLTRFQNDLTTINNNGNHNPVINNILDKLNDLENQPVNAPLIGPVTLKNNASELLNFVPSYSLNDLGTRFDTPGGFAHKILAKVIPDESKLDQIGAVMHVLNNAANNSALKQAYSNVVNDLTKLPSQNKAQQASTLSDLSNHISTFASDVSTQGNSYLPNQDKQYFDGITSNLDQAHQAVSKESAKLNGQVSDNINSELNQYNAGSLFNNVINYVIVNNDYAKLDSVANDAKTDFANATNASGFISNFVDQIANLKNADATSIKTDLQSVEHNQVVSDAYNVAKANSDAANSVLNNLAGLNSANVTDNLDNVHNAISGNASLVAINALSNVAASASTEATSVNDANDYQNLINNESTLFSAVVNRINVSGFNSAAFKTLVGNAENDLANAANVSDFADDLNGQAGAFNGVTAQKIKGYLTNLKNNPKFSDAYQAVRASSADADNILNDLSGMNSANEVTKLSDIANVAKNDFSNSASFGSFTDDALAAVNNVATSQVNSAYQDAQNYADLAGQASTSAQTSAHDAQQYASGLPSNEASTEAKNEAGKANDDAEDAVRDAGKALNAADQAREDSLEVNGDEHPVAAVHGFGAMAPETKEEYVHDAVQKAQDAKRYDAQAQKDLSNVKQDFTNAQRAANQAQNTPDVSVISRMMPTVLNAITKPNFDSHDFNLAINDVNSHLNDGNLVALWNSVKNNSSVKAFTNHYGAATNQVTNLLNNDDSNDFKALNQAYQQAHNDSKVKNILSDLQTIANNHKNADGKSASQQTNDAVQKALQNIANVINGDNSLKAIQGMQQVAKDAGNEAIHYNPSVEITPSVQGLDGMLKPILNRIVARGFNGSAFQNAIKAIKDNIRNAGTLSNLWAKIQSNNGVQYFVGNHGKLTQNIISKLSETNSPLEAAYEAGHQDPAMTRILNDLSDVSKHQQVGDNQVAKQSDISSVDYDLSDINKQINDSNTLKQIDGAQTLMNHVSYNPTVIVKPDVNSIEPLINGLLNRMTAANFNSRDFDNVIKAVKDNINSAPSLSKLWSDIDNDQSGVKHFTGSLSHAVASILNDGNSQTMKHLNAAYQKAHQDSRIMAVLNDLQQIADNHLNSHSLAQQNDKRAKIVEALSDLNTQITGVNNSDKITGLSEIANDAKEAEGNYQPQNVKPSVESINGLVPLVLNRITSNGFDKGAFRSAIVAVEDNMNQTDSLSKLWSAVKNNSGVKHFIGKHGELTDQIVNDLINSDPQLEVAYEAGHKSNSVKDILTQLSDIANDSLDANDKSAKVEHALTQIANDLNDSSLSSINKGNLSNEVNSLSSNYSPVSLPFITRDFVNDILGRLTDPQFNKDGFKSAIMNPNDGIEHALATQNTLAGFWNAIQHNSGVKAFINAKHLGKLTGQIENVLKNDPQYNAAYQVAHDDSANVDHILSDLNDIAQQELDSNGKNNQVDNDLADVAKVIQQDPKLQAVGSLPTVENTAQADDHNYQEASHQVVPHYGDDSFNEALGHLINHYTVKDVVDHLASIGDSANSDENKAVHAIIGDLSNLPSLSDQTDINRKLGNVYSELNHFHGPVSHFVAGKLQSLLSNIEDHDKTPDDLAAYADQIGDPNGALINDFDKTMQDVKNDLNNADYRKVLNEFSNLNTKNEDHNLKAIAAAINAHGLKNNPLLKDLALQVHHVANDENSIRKTNNDKIRKAEAAQKTALQNQHNADSKRHNALTKDLQQHKQDVARHNQIIQDHNRQKQDAIRHNELVADRHQHNRHDAARAESYAKDTSTEAQAATKSAASAQQYAHGLNSKGNEAYGNSTMASMEVFDVNSYEREVTSDSTQALDDVKAIAADYDNVSLADADVANASSAASDASNAVSSMDYAITLASKFAKSDGYVAPSSSTSNGSGKSSGTSNSSSSAPSSTSSGKASGKSSTSSNGTQPSSKSSVTPSASNGKKKSGSASQSTSNQPSSKSAHASSGSSSQTSGKSASGSANGSHSNSSRPTSSKASNGSASHSTASSGKSNPSSQASKSASQSGNSNSASAPSSNQSNSSQPSSGSNPSASNSNSNSASQSNVPSSNNSSMNGSSSTSSKASNVNSNASASSNGANSQSTSSGSYNPFPFVPSNDNNGQNSNNSFVPASSFNGSQNSDNATSTASVENSVASSSVSASVDNPSRDKIRNDRSMVNNDVINAMKALNASIVKRDPKITAEVKRDRQMLRNLQSHIAKDLANPTPRTLRDANSCAVRAGLIVHDANRLLNAAEYYGISHMKRNHAHLHHARRSSRAASGRHSVTQNTEPAAQSTTPTGVSNEGNVPSAGASSSVNAANGQSNNAGKLPQTGEAQNATMIIMGLIALSAALISALGVDLDKKRRRE